MSDEMVPMVANVRLNMVDDEMLARHVMMGDEETHRLAVEEWRNRYRADYRHPTRATRVAHGLAWAQTKQ